MHRFIYPFFLEGEGNDKKTITISHEDRIIFMLFAYSSSSSHCRLWYLYAVVFTYNNERECVKKVGCTDLLLIRSCV